MGRPRSAVEVEQSLGRLFRERGYDGLSLSDFERQTGMAKASLYHRFPGGKDEMARAVLVSVADDLQTGLLQSMAEAKPQIAARLLERGLIAYYEGGKLGCLLGAFAPQVAARRFRPEMQRLHGILATAIRRMLMQSGLALADARARTEDFLVDVQGSLILAAISGKPRDFVRRLKKAVLRLTQAGD